MNNASVLATIATVAASVGSVAAEGVPATRDSLESSPQRPRLLIMTDIGGDPDDTQSLVRLMLYANAFELEGFVATSAGIPGELKEPKTCPERILAVIAAYGEVRSRLEAHEPGFPDAGLLASRVRSGSVARGLDAVGEGRDSPGSEHIRACIEAGTEDRPLNIAIWGGQTDLAQALWRIRAERGAGGVAEAVRKFRVYDINDQDSLADWMFAEFPGMTYILAKSQPGRDKREGLYRGIYLTGDISTTSREWIQANIALPDSPLGKLYPLKTGTSPNPNNCMKEGDTPSWFFFLPKGGNDPVRPEKPGWGGEFVRDKDGRYRDRPAAEGFDPRTTVSRWRPEFQADFARRMAWTRITLP